MVNDSVAVKKRENSAINFKSKAGTTSGNEGKRGRNAIGPRAPLGGAALVVGRECPVCNSNFFFACCRASFFGATGVGIALLTVYGLRLAGLRQGVAPLVYLRPKTPPDFRTGRKSKQFNDRGKCRNWEPNWGRNPGPSGSRITF